MNTAFCFAPARLLVQLLIALTLFSGRVNAQQDCSFLAVVVDESGSMENEQAFIRNTAMEPLITALELELEQQVIVCSYGFSARGNLGATNIGCSVGFDVNDYSFITAGGTEDGFRAIHEAAVHAKALTEVDGFSLTSCPSVSLYSC